MLDGRAYRSPPAPSEPVAGSPTYRLILRVLREHGELTRPDLSLLTHVPKTTLRDHVRVMIRRGDVVELPVALSGRRGRPASALALPPRRGVAAVQLLTRGKGAVDGASTCALVSLEGEVIASQVLPPAAEQVRRGVHAFRAMSASTSGTGALRGAVLGVPLPLDLSRSPSHEAVAVEAEVAPGARSWLDARPHGVLAAALDVPVLLGNDSDLGALGEVQALTDQGITDVAYVKCIDDMSVGLTRAGRLLTAGESSGGELGQLLVEESAAICGGCGREAVQGGRASSLWDRLADDGRGVATLEDVQLAVAAKEPRTLRSLIAHGEAIGRALRALGVIYRPQVVAFEARLGVLHTPVAEGCARALGRGSPLTGASQTPVRVERARTSAEVVGAAIAVGRAPRVTDA